MSESKLKAFEFRKDIFLSVFKTALTVGVLILSAMVSVLYRQGFSSIPWLIIGFAGIVLDGILLTWSAKMILELAGKG